MSNNSVEPELFTRKHISFSEQFDPVLFGELAMRVQPSPEGAVLFSQFLDLLRVDDGSINLQSVTDDPRMGKQAQTILFAVPGNPVDIKAMKSFPKVVCLLQDRDSEESCLVDLEPQPLEQQVVILKQKTVLRIVVRLVVGIFRMGVETITVGGQGNILVSSRLSGCEPGIPGKKMDAPRHYSK